MMSWRDRVRRPPCRVPDVLRMGAGTTNMEMDMSKIGDRFKTGQPCDTTGSYVFDGYVDGTYAPAPTQEERVIPLSKGEPFPPVRSAQKACWWKLQRIT